MIPVEELTEERSKACSFHFDDSAALLHRDQVLFLTCDCGGHRAIVGDISEREVMVAILAHLGLPAEARPRARARSPAFEGA